jgi:hypothetical protein
MIVSFWGREEGEVGWDLAVRSLTYVLVVLFSL